LIDDKSKQSKTDLKRLKVILGFPVKMSIKQRRDENNYSSTITNDFALQIEVRYEIKS
jgi:hypothetical protein